MGLFDETRFLERLQFFDGQRLVASDLQNLEAFHRELRELHNQSLHQPGIGNGFAVTGERGDREVTIGPGYATDAEGHEIILTTTQTEQVPPVESEEDGGPVFYDLTVSYPADEDLEESETRQGICLRRGVVRLREEPVFCWIRLERDGAGALHPRDGKLKLDIQQARKIVLARAEILQCQLERLSINERRNARPPSQPRIFCARFLPSWRTQFVQVGETRGMLFLEATIDTSEAGFVTAPCYSARIDGPSEFVVGTNNQQVFAQGLISVHDSTATEFSVTVAVHVVPFGADVEALVTRLWKVEWMGIE